MKVCRWWSNDNIHKYDNDDIDDDDFLVITMVVTMVVTMTMIESGIAPPLGIRYRIVIWLNY